MTGPELLLWACLTLAACLALPFFQSLGRFLYWELRWRFRKRYERPLEYHCSFCRWSQAKSSMDAVVEAEWWKWN